MHGPLPSGLTLESAWNEYAKIQFNALTPPLRVQEARVHFFSGALALSTLQEIVSQPNVHARVGEQVLLSLRNEVEQFLAEAKGNKPTPDKPSLVLVKP